MGTLSNTSGIGARIRVKATVGGSPVWQMREVSGSDGYCSHNLRQHFGLGDATTVDSLVVSWPSGTVQAFEGVAGDQLLTVMEPFGVKLLPLVKALGHPGLLLWFAVRSGMHDSMDTWKGHPEVS